MTATALQFNKFEIKSNVNDDTVDLRGTGNPIIEYRESVFMPYIGGLPEYVKKCEQVVENEYEGFILA